MGLLDKVNKNGKIKKTDKTVKKKEDSLDVTTIPDKIYHLIEKEGKIKLHDIAENLSMSKRDAEEWVKMLDKQGMAELHYPTIGSPIVKKIGHKNEKGFSLSKTTKLIIFTIVVVIVVSLMMYVLVQRGIITNG